MTSEDEGSTESDAPLPEAIASLLDGPITEDTVAALRRHYDAAPLDASRSGELLAIAARAGDRAGPALQAFLRERMARVLMDGFTPFPRR